MTQAMQFSAFKGPFADRIDVWNGKLYMVSDLPWLPSPFSGSYLEEWHIAISACFFPSQSCFRIFLVLLGPSAIQVAKIPLQAMLASLRHCCDIAVFSWERMSGKSPPRGQPRDTGQIIRTCRT